jgi:hypothetical protein
MEISIHREQNVTTYMLEMNIAYIKEAVSSESFNGGWRLEKGGRVDKQKDRRKVERKRRKIDGR